MNFLSGGSRRPHLCFHSSSCRYMGVLYCLALWWVLGIVPVLGSPSGGRGEIFFEALAHFHVQIAQIHGGHLSTLFSVLILPFRSCNLASSNQFLHPVQLSLFPQKASSQGVLAVSVLNFCFLVPPPMRASEYKLSGQVLYHLHGVTCPPPSSQTNLENNLN